VAGEGALVSTDKLQVIENKWLKDIGPIFVISIGKQLAYVP